MEAMGEDLENQPSVTRSRILEGVPTPTFILLGLADIHRCNVHIRVRKPGPPDINSGIFEFDMLCKELREDGIFSLQLLEHSGNALAMITQCSGSYQARLAARSAEAVPTSV